jgi:hypothetical protein
LFTPAFVPTPSYVPELRPVPVRRVTTPAGEIARTQLSVLWLAYIVPSTASTAR